MIAFQIIFKSLLVITFLTSSLAASAAESAENFDFTAANKEGYWYSRYNLGHLVMRSGLGEKFRPNPNMVQAMLAMAGDGVSQAKPAKAPALLKRVFDRGNPAWINASNGNMSDFSNFRWAESTEKTTSGESFGWTMIKEIEWSKQFNVDFHFGRPNEIPIPGAQQRFAGLVLCAESLMQYSEFKTKPEQFDLSESASQYVALSALSNLAHFLNTQSSPLMSNNRCAQVAAMMHQREVADIAADILGTARHIYSEIADPKTIRDHAIAIQSLVWYAQADIEARDVVKSTLVKYGDALEQLEAQSATDQSNKLRAFVELNRVLTEEKYSQLAQDIWFQLLVDFDAKLAKFNSQDSYKVSEIAAILGGLNAHRLFVANDSKTAQDFLALVFNSLVNLSGLQISAPPLALIPEYERGKEIYHRHPLIPVPPKANNRNGIAPVFAASVNWDPVDSKWSAEKTLFETAGSMRLANEMIWFHNAEVNGFPSIVLE